MSLILFNCHFSKIESGIETQLIVFLQQSTNTSNFISCLQSSFMVSLQVDYLIPSLSSHSQPLVLSCYGQLDRIIQKKKQLLFIRQVPTFVISRSEIVGYKHITLFKCLEILRVRISMKEKQI